MTILVRFGADFIYTAEDADNPSIDARYPNMTFPMPGPGMFVDLLKKSVPPQPSPTRVAAPLTPPPQQTGVPPQQTDHSSDAGHRCHLVPAAASTAAARAAT